MSSPNPALTRYVDALIRDRYHTASALAEAIGMKMSAFSRGIREDGTLSVENCINLAAEVGEHPATIVRIARGKHGERVARALERLHGHTKSTLSRRDLEHITLWKSLDAHSQNTINALIYILLESADHHVTAAFASGHQGPRLVKERPRARKPRAGSLEPAGR